MSSSVVQRTCPSCSADTPAQAERCRCGHAFLAGEAGADAQQLEEAELFEDYLRARVDQAVTVLEAARDELAREPKNIEKAMRVLKAVREADLCRGELVAQAVLIRKMRESLTHAAPQGAQPGEAFRANQAARAEQIVARFEGTTTKACPECGTTLPGVSVLCFCGHRFAEVAEGSRRRASDLQALPNVWQA